MNRFNKNLNNRLSMVLLFLEKIPPLTLEDLEPICSQQLQNWHLKATLSVMDVIKPLEITQNTID